MFSILSTHLLTHCTYKNNSLLVVNSYRFHSTWKRCISSCCHGNILWQGVQVGGYTPLEGHETPDTHHIGAGRKVYCCVVEGGRGRGNQGFDQWKSFSSKVLDRLATVVGQKGRHTSLVSLVHWFLPLRGHLDPLINSYKRCWSFDSILIPVANTSTGDMLPLVSSRL